MISYGNKENIIQQLSGNEGSIYTNYMMDLKILSLTLFQYYLDYEKINQILEDCAHVLYIIFQN